MNKSFQVSVIPGKHQCMQSSCLFPPAVDGWASALNSLTWVMSKIWKLVPLMALNRCLFTRRDSTFVPLFFREKNSSTCEGNEETFKLCITLQNKNETIDKHVRRIGTDYASLYSSIQNAFKLSKEL